MEPGSDQNVFPASAGMILDFVGIGKIVISVPRIRGDDPHHESIGVGVDECSPHPRG